MSSRVRPILVGVVGGAGSGKKYFSDMLASLLRKRAIDAVEIEHQKSPYPRLAGNISKTKSSSSSVLPPTADCILYHGLEDSLLRTKLDVKVFLDVDSDLRLANLLEENNGRTNDIIAAHEYHVQHVMKQRKFADIWLDSVNEEKAEQVADIIMKVRREYDKKTEQEPKEIEVYLDKYEKAPDVPVPGDFI